MPAPFQLEEVIYEGVDSSINLTCNDDTSVVPIAFIATEGKNIYLAFRGTANISDSLADILHTQVPYSLVSNGGKVSEGFLNKYMGTDTNPIRATIFSKLERKGRPFSVSSKRTCCKGCDDSRAVAPQKRRNARRCLKWALSCSLTKRSARCSSAMVKTDSQSFVTSGSRKTGAYST